MKSNWIIVLFFSITFNVCANEIESFYIEDIILKNNMYASFELKNDKNKNLVLDCQSFINHLSILDSKPDQSIKMVNYGDCESIQNYIEESLQNKSPVCLNIDFENQEIIFTRDDKLNCI